MRRRIAANERKESARCSFLLPSSLLPLIFRRDREGETALGQQQPPPPRGATRCSASQRSQHCTRRGNRLAAAALEPSRRDDRAREWFRTRERFDRDGDGGGEEDEAKKNERREDERRAGARGEKRSRGAPVLLYISRPSSGRQIDSVGAPPFSPPRKREGLAAHRASIRSWYHVASHLFTLTQYLLGRIGESAVRSFARPASLFRDRLRLPLSRPLDG